MKKTVFGQTLVRLRKTSGFQSGRSFYLYMQKMAGPQMEYSYYLKLERGDILPSAKLAHQLAHFYEKPDKKKSLLMAFCQDLFPNDKNWFKIPTVNEKKDIKLRPSQTVYPQEYLTERQVAIIAKSFEHYLIFMMVTLARETVTEAQLSNYIATIQLSAIICDLINDKILVKTSDGIKSTSVERLFPPADSYTLKQIYKKLDAWDLILPDKLLLQSKYTKTYLRRISPRYTELLHQHCSMLINFVELADEVDDSKNDDVIFISLKLFQGHLPG